MESLYHQTNELIEEIQFNLGNLEKATGENAHIVENEILARIDQITSNCERLDILVNKELPAKKHNAKLRVSQLKYDCQHLQAALRNLQHRRYARATEEQQREELLSRSFQPNDSSTSIMIDQALQHNTALQNTHRNLDNLIGSGSSILDNLRFQKNSLKGAHKKILDVANTLGLSNTVMRLVEKRTFQDKIILFGGMAVTLIIMFLIWKYIL